MPLYVYKALTSDGRELVQEGLAQNREELRIELESRGMLLKSVKQKRSSLSPFGRMTVRTAEFLQYNQELMTLLKAGLTLPDALDLASDRPENKAFGKILRSVLEDVRTGSSFSAACARHVSIFDGLYLSSLKAGEKTGNFAGPLARYQEHLKRKEALRAKVSQALVYPIFLLIVLVAVMGLLFVFVMPRFTALYADFNATLPLPTRVLTSLVENLPLAGTVLGGSLLGAWILWKVFTATPAGRLAVDSLKQSLPPFAGFVQPWLLSQWSRTLSTLLGGGTPLVEALQVTGEAVTNRAFAKKLEGTAARVLDGESFSRAAAAGKLASRSALKLIEVGEASGSLGKILEDVADSADQILESRIRRLLSLIEPVFILVTGLLIGMVIVVMYLPILHLSDVVK